MRNIHNKILLGVVSSFLFSSSEVSALAFDFGSFFNKVKTGAVQFVQTNPYAQNIYNNAAQNFGQVLSNTKQQAALATQGISGNLQQYAQQQGQQIGQQALQQRPQNFSQGVDYITKTAEDFGKGAWGNVQTVNQGITANTPIAQQISLMTGSLNGALQLSGSALQSVMLPVGDNGATIALWLNEAQNTLSLLGQTNPQAMGMVELINMTQNQVKGIPTLAYKQQSGGMLMPGNVNWDYLVDSKGMRYSPEGVSLGGASPSYSDDQDLLVKIEKKRYAMRNLCVKIYNILISSTAQLSAIDQNLPQVILSTLQNLSKVGPTEQNADYYIKLATDQITATATMLKYSGQVKPVDNSWSVLVDSNGNYYSGNGLTLNNVPAQQFNNVPAATGYNNVPAQQFNNVPAATGYSNASATNQFNNVPAQQFNNVPAATGYNGASATNQFNNVPAQQFNNAPAATGYNGASATNQFNNVPAQQFNNAPAAIGYNNVPAQQFNNAPAATGYNGASATNQFNNIPAQQFNNVPAAIGYNNVPAQELNNAPAPTQKMAWDESSASIESGGFDVAPAGYIIPD